MLPSSAAWNANRKVRRAYWRMAHDDALSNKKRVLYYTRHHMLRTQHTVFLVTMQRVYSQHAYVLGAFSSYHKARLHGGTEEAWRGGRYAAQVSAIPYDAVMWNGNVEYCD